MSYNLDLSQLRRDAATSINAQLVELVKGAIERGDLRPGDRLPTTRAVADEAGLNHLTVVRAYRRLAQEGYVTATRGRGTFVRQAPPVAGEGDGRWQHAVLPEARRSYVNQVLADTWQPLTGEDHVNLATGWASPELHPADQLARMSAAIFADAGAAALM